MDDFFKKYDGLESLNEEQINLLIEFEMDSYKNNISSYNSIHASYTALVTAFSMILGFLITLLSIAFDNNGENNYLSVIILVLLIVFVFISLMTCLYFFRTKSFTIESPYSIFDVIDCDTKHALFKKYNYYRILNNRYDQININKNKWLRIVTDVLYIIIIILCVLLFTIIF